MEVLSGFNAKTSVYLDENENLYVKHKSTNNRIYLRCYSSNCKGRAVIISDRYNLLADHDHHSNHRNTISVLRFREQLRQDVESYPEKPPKMVFEEAQLRDHAAANLVGYSDVRNLLFKTRQQLCPPIPQNLEEMASYLDVERFRLRYGTELGANRRPYYSGLLISPAGDKNLTFSSQAVIAMCRNKTIICGMDATYKVVPKAGGAYQRFGIYFLMDGTAYPIMLTLMERKTKTAYACILAKFKRFCDDNDTIIESVITDYELALRAAISQVFTATEVVGCYFHFARAVFMRFKADGLTRACTPERWLAIKMMMSVALLPNDKVLSAIELIRATLPNDQGFQTFCQYMVRQWGNQNVSVFNQEVRTNNSVESFHRFIFRIIGRAHPNVWVFLIKLLQIEHTKSVQLTRRRHGEELSQPRRLKYRRKDKIIQQAQNTFQSNGDIDLFLRTLIRNANSMVDAFDPVPNSHDDVLQNSASAGSSMNGGSTSGLINRSELAMAIGNALIPPTNALIPPTNALIPSTNALIPPTNALIPPTNALIPPTNALIPPRNALIPPTNALIPPRNALIPPTNALIPPTNALIPSTNALIPPTNALIPPTNALIPPTNALIPPRNAIIPPTNALIPPTNALIPPTNALIPPTNALIPPTNALIPPTNTLIPPTNALIPLTNALIPSTNALIPPTNACSSAPTISSAAPMTNSGRSYSMVSGLTPALAVGSVLMTPTISSSSPNISSSSAPAMINGSTPALVSDAAPRPCPVRGSAPALAVGSVLMTSTTTSSFASPAVIDDSTTGLVSDATVAIDSMEPTSGLISHTTLSMAVENAFTLPTMARGSTILASSAAAMMNVGSTSGLINRAELALAIDNALILPTNACSSAPTRSSAAPMTNGGSSYSMVSGLTPALAVGSVLLTPTISSSSPNVTSSSAPAMINGSTPALVSDAAPRPCPVSGSALVIAIENALSLPTLARGSIPTVSSAAPTTIDASRSDLVGNSELAMTVDNPLMSTTMVSSLTPSATIRPIQLTTRSTLNLNQEFEFESSDSDFETPIRRSARPQVPRQQPNLSSDGSDTDYEELNRNIMQELYGEMDTVLESGGDSDEPIVENLPLDDELTDPCTVCMIRNRSFAFTDCGHKCICEVCSSKFRILASNMASTEDAHKKCPICRTIIRRRPIRIY